MSLLRALALAVCRDEHYTSEHERGILWNGPALNISWDITDPILSPKDAENLRLADVPKNLLPPYSPK